MKKINFAAFAILWALPIQAWGQTSNDELAGTFEAGVFDRGFDTEAQRSEEYVPIIRFGVGASYLMPVRTDDRGSSRSVLSEFSMSWCPFGVLGEIGFDLAMTRKSAFFARPNLKIFPVKNNTFSMFLGGHYSIYSHPQGVEQGAGSSLGVVIGLGDNLALELTAAASLYYSMSPDGADSLVKPEPGTFALTATEATNQIAVLFGGAKVMARF